MSELQDLFSGFNFKQTIQRYCDDRSWRIANITDKIASLQFTMKSGRDQTLFIMRYETTLEFSVPSMAKFNSDDDIPHFLSTLLLKRSSQRKIGFWCIEDLGDKLVYSCMHNAEMKLINSEYFASVVRALIVECDEFEGVLLEMVNS